MNVNKPTILLVILIVAIPCLSWANKDLVDPIDKRFEECIDKDSTTLGMTNCLKESMEAWDKELNTVYTELMNRLDTKGKAALKKSQRQWMKYRDDQFQFISAYYDGFQGTMYVPLRAGDKAGVIKERTIILRSYLKLLDMR